MTRAKKDLVDKTYTKEPCKSRPHYSSHTAPPSHTTKPPNPTTRSPLQNPQSLHSPSTYPRHVHTCSRPLPSAHHNFTPAAPQFPRPHACSRPDPRTYIVGKTSVFRSCGAHVCGTSLCMQGRVCWDVGSGVDTRLAGLSTSVATRLDYKYTEPTGTVITKREVLRK
ncbi:hypothetical protein IQ07DRAFT_276453 [Pyrenochaeta sp. DS3sAY3a]|nr:hypothetical protein IQ07DRAFT_276453 [Pyrenochaeta sp. DS3sAY3a]